MSVLAKSEILRWMNDAVDPLVVTPLLKTEQIGPASVDVRLGHEFIVWRRSSLSSIDRTESTAHWEALLHRSQQRIRVSLFEEFVLHPGELVLGATLEYLCVPSGVAASVEGRSSWGRLGLIVATATTVAPGFKGCLTLEIVNNGEVPLVVYPGVVIAQLVFHQTAGSGSYDGSYQCPTGPEFTKAEQSLDGRVWGKGSRTRLLRAKAEKNAEG